MNADTKDFLLHLYDKLWENMGAKESRLWNYLSIYGAAVALTLGAGKFSGEQLAAVMIVLGLTTWAVLIVVNANWWYQRNRLIVTQIEKRFSPGPELDGIIPRSYRDGIFQFDRLYRGSVLILTAIAVFLYWRVLFDLRQPEAFSSLAEVTNLGLIYVLFTTAVTYCCNQHESYISSYYSSKKDLLSELEELPEIELTAKLADQKDQAIQSYTWLWSGLTVLVAVFVLFDVLPGLAVHHYCSRLLVGISSQIVALLCFVGVVLAAREAKFPQKTFLFQKGQQPAPKVDGKGRRKGDHARPLLFILVVVFSAISAVAFLSEAAIATRTTVGKQASASVHSSR